MTEARGGSQPDPAIALANFLRSAIRAIATDKRQPHICSMVGYFAQFQSQTAELGGDTVLRQIYDRAIENLVKRDEQTAVVEAQLDFAVSGMQVLVDLSSADENRDQRLVQSRKQMRNDLKWLDQVRAGYRIERDTR